MTEELKLLIRAEVADAQKKLQAVQKEVKGIDTGAKKASGGFQAAMKGIAKGAAIAVAAITAIGAAIVATANKTEEYREIQARLVAGFQSTGKSAEQAKKTYSELFRFIGDTDTAAEAANHLALLTDSQENLAEWTNIAQGVYATFGDSLKTEALTEAANETARVGKVTGAMADALNWAGVSEDAMNEALAQNTSLQEREALLRSTLNGLYSDASRIYEENNKTILESRDAQNRFNEAMAGIGNAVAPAATAIRNMGASLLEALLPAINAVMPYITAFVNAIAEAFTWVASLFGALSGKSKETSNEVVSNVGKATSSLGNAGSGAGALTQGLEKAADAAKELKKQTAGFDELNVMSSQTSSASSGGSSGGGGSAGAGGYGGGISFDTSAFDEGLEKGTSSAEKFANKLKDVFSKIKSNVVEWAKLFTPSFDAWKKAFQDLKNPVMEASVSVKDSLTAFINDSLLPFSGYVLEDFIPSITNAFSETLAPIFTDIMGFAVTQFATDFQWACEQVNLLINDVLMPAFELIKTIVLDTFQMIKAEWDKSGGTLLTNVSKFFESIRGIWDNFYQNVLKPVLDIVFDALNDIWKESLQPLLANIISFTSKVGELVLLLWNNILAPIVNWIVKVLGPTVVDIVSVVVSVVKTVFKAISDVVGGIFKALGGLLDFIIGIFTGDWNRAWQGIKDFFSGIWNAIWGLVKGIINLIIDAINLLWSGIYTVIRALVNGIGAIAGAIGSILGKDWKFSMPKQAPKIPKLATGGIVNSATLAQIGENGREAVLPLENNTEWMDVLADKIANRNASPSKIVLQIDGKELGWASINSINQITKQSGELQLAII